ncbi:ScyD/ScyE family protein [Pseudarthrobacter sp. LT1]|uniref:ScyD/ScyE family protein n=1 Tax=Pseudarthrobacter sp. LT1 TaxID=3111450 RepID=UPI002D76848D|nr:ScyD/ScyE family protein [Pseudarthrobacter sp. LT1]WRT15348.1 ScyD/ScyE family protein [Pseudarthrobacter sp. LT1]
MAASAAAIASAGPAAASAKTPDYDVLAGGFVSPLHVTAGPGKSVLVSQDFAGKLTRIDRDGSTEDLSTDTPQGWEVAGADTRGSTTYFLESVGAGQGDPAGLHGYLKSIDARGDVETIADFADYERSHNPDGDQHYGFGDDVSAQCLAAWPEFPPPSYKGIVDSHPYALAVRDNTAYVADAGMNAVLKVNLKTGDIDTVAVLPPRPAVVPAGLRIPTDMMGNTVEVPACVVGHEYAFEPVPTDVGIGPDGMLYVTSLPGGPEGPELGARGAIFRINPWNGDTDLWAEDILSPTGLAVAGNGDVYVASLFGGEILKFTCDGDRSQFLAVNMPADVDISGHTLYATIDALGDPSQPPAGKVIKADLR